MTKAKAKTKLKKPATPKAKELTTNPETSKETEHKTPTIRMGRPPKYETPEQMETAINNYFTKCKIGEKKQIITKSGEVVETTKEIPLTIADLAYHLGFTNRQSILDYEKKDDKFSGIIVRARLHIEGDNIRKGLTGEYNSQTNNLNLASNYGYSMKSEIEVKGAGGTTINIINYNSDQAIDITPAADQIAEKVGIQKIVGPDSKPA